MRADRHGATVKVDVLPSQFHDAGHTTTKRASHVMRARKNTRSRPNGRYCPHRKNLGSVGVCLRVRAARPTPYEPVFLPENAVDHEILRSARVFPRNVCVQSWRQGVACRDAKTDVRAVTSLAVPGFQQASFRLRPSSSLRRGHERGAACRHVLALAPRQARGRHSP